MKLVDLEPWILVSSTGKIRGERSRGPLDWEMGDSSLWFLERLTGKGRLCWASSDGRSRDRGRDEAISAGGSFLTSLLSGPWKEKHLFHSLIHSSHIY